MDIPRLTSPPPNHLFGFNSNNDRRRPVSKSSSRSPPSQSFSSHGPMAIRNAREDLAPPALPPPRFMDDLANGQDLGWEYANSPDKGGLGKSTLAPIKPSSSLYGSYRGPPDSPHRSKRMTPDDSDRRRYTSSGRSPPSAQVKIEPPVVEEGFQNSMSSTTSNPLLAYSLQGTLSQKSVERSSNAYDQHLLSKIGRPTSPPRQLPGLGKSLGDKGPSQSSLSFGSKTSSNLNSLSASDATPESGPRWGSSPQSAAVSPGTKVGWKDYIGYRSGSVDSSAPSSAIDPESYSSARDQTKRTDYKTSTIYEGSSSVGSRSNRGSYDQNVFSDPEVDFPMEETGKFRQLNIGDSLPPPMMEVTPLSKQGMKRRASSPPREATKDGKHTLHTATSNGDLAQRRTTGHPFTNLTSPNNRYQPNHGSISSASSASLRTGSYASSTGLSLGGSSMTSMSSYDHHSRAVSPTSDIDPKEHSFGTASARGSLSSAPPTSRPQDQRRPTEHKITVPVQKRSVQPTLSTTKSGATRIGGLHICECCPKKPKKFDNPEDLHAHEMEKQYTCQFCRNRFKNKNEAERHQNSLHLRRYSWSCAALSGYEAAFHNSATPSSQTPSGASHDACGYCGEEFPNFPQPDWMARIEHLTNVHKFGECNQAKKFYRADHFRQHLKHSHAGTSGKWTNILENACMKDELPESRTPSVGEQGGRRPSGSTASPPSAPTGNSSAGNSEAGAGPTTAPSSSTSGGGTLATNTINEVLDETG